MINEVNRRNGALGSLVLLAAATLSGIAHADGSSVLPFDMPAKEVLQQSPKKVFAHYVPWFPISLDNLPAANDYYTWQYMNPAGENGKYAGAGGLMRARPMPQPPVADPNWKLLNMEKEVRSAIQVGLDGFSVDVPSWSGTIWDNVNLLMQAATNVDPNFKILLMPDMESFKSNPLQLKPAMLALSKYPSAFRLDDGRLVISPFDAQDWQPSMWSAWLASMHVAGVDVAFVPTFQDWDNYASTFQSISAGFADWGTASAVAAQADPWRLAPTRAHQYVPIWMAPVRPQDFRPSWYNYREAATSTNFRKNWTTAILGKADWVNILTWNDYGEGTEIAPSTGTQQAFFDLTAYYVVWFKTGQPPPITRDVIYYFHRLQNTMAVPNWSKQYGGPMRFMSEWPGDARRDDVEVVSFLTAPATLTINVGGVAQPFDAPAGQYFFHVPLAEGRPSFQVTRNGAAVIDFQSAFTISNTIVYQDLLYRGGSNTRPPVPTQ